MRYSLILLLLFILLLFSISVKGQCLPLEQIVIHLTEVGEIKLLEDREATINEVDIAEWFNVFNKALYVFSSKSIHNYKFILLKSNDTFLILNCNDFINEYQIMTNQFFNEIIETFNTYLPNIIQIYIENQNYHKTPPIIKLEINTLEEKINYLPRKLKNTEPFYFRCKE